MDQPEVRFLGDLQRLRPQPGDVFVLSCGGALSAEAHARLTAYLQHALGSDAKVLILDRGLTLGVVGQPSPVITVNGTVGSPASAESVIDAMSTVARGLTVGTHNGVQIEPGKKYTFPPELVALPVREMSVHEVQCSTKDAALLESDEARRQYYRTMVECGAMTSAEMLDARFGSSNAAGLTTIATDNERPDGRPARTPGA